MGDLDLSDLGECAGNMEIYGDSFVHRTMGCCVYIVIIVRHFFRGMFHHLG